MTRPLRIQFPGAFYHITSRGNERLPIFLSIAVRKKFLDYLQQGHDRFGFFIHAYCLMGNHYHLIMETPQGNLSQAMHFLNGSFAAYTNTLHERSGHLLQGRYRSILIEAENYAKELSRYIHLNPVRAKIVENPEDYRWSSFREYITAGMLPCWLRTNLILGYFSESNRLARKQYYRFVLERTNAAKTNPLDDVCFSTLLGSKEFIARIKNEFIDVAKQDRDLPQLRALRNRPPFDLIQSEVEKAAGKQTRLGRRIDIYLCRQHSGLSLKQLGSLFSLGESGVSQVHRRLKAEISSDNKTARLVSDIEQKIFCQMCRSDPIKDG